MNDPIPRGTEAIACECNGYADRVECTAEEIRKYGCGRDSIGAECCARAFVCRNCGKRIAGKAEAPEAE